VVIPDHTPQMTCSAAWHAGMAHTLGYIAGVLAMLKNEGERAKKATLRN
jgi:mannonate dehydratase